MENIWTFGQFTFKNATTLLLLENPTEETEIDRALKKMIDEQFEHISDLRAWVITNYDKVI